MRYSSSTWSQRLLLCCIALSLAGCGITAPKGGPGYADFDALELSDATPSSSISFGPTLIGMAKMFSDETHSMPGMLENIEGVRVQTYDLSGETYALSDSVEQLRRAMQSQGWHPVVVVREPGEHTVFMVKVEEERVLGLTVVSVDEEEAVLVNIMGRVSIDSLIAAAGAMSRTEDPEPVVAVAPAPGGDS